MSLSYMMIRLLKLLKKDVISSTKFGNGKIFGTSITPMGFMPFGYIE